MISETVGNEDYRKSFIKEGVILSAAPYLSLFIVGPLSQLFSSPNPLPVKAFIGIVLLTASVSGVLGLKRINQGRARRFDGLGLLCLGLMSIATLLNLIFFFGAVVVYGRSFYGVVPYFPR
jgi:hypothetical protein